MKREVLKRIEAIEKETIDRCVLWIDPPEGGLAGWEILPTTGESLRVWREGSEADDALNARAAGIANQHRGMVVCFAMDANGVTR